MLELKKNEFWRSIMKLFSSILMIIMFSIGISFSQVSKKKYALTSDQLQKQEKELDKQIEDIVNKMKDLAISTDLVKREDIRIIPFQTTFKNGDGKISIEKYFLRKNKNYMNKVTGISTKKIILTFSGNSISKIESLITDKDYRTGEHTIVNIVDNSPGKAGTDDIIFSYKHNKRVILDKKKMGDVKNTTAFPVKNNLKRDFLVPHLTYFYDSMMFIAQSYSKSLKDADSNMSDFLKDSLK